MLKVTWVRDRFCEVGGLAYRVLCIVDWVLLRTGEDMDGMGGKGGERRRGGKEDG
jgi:hypothetical protein